MSILSYINPIIESSTIVIILHQMLQPFTFVIIYVNIMLPFVDERVHYVPLIYDFKLNTRLLFFPQLLSLRQPRTRCRLADGRAVVSKVTDSTYKRNSSKCNMMTITSCCNYKRTMTYHDVPCQHVPPCRPETPFCPTRAYLRVIQAERGVAAGERALEREMKDVLSMLDRIGQTVRSVQEMEHPQARRQTDALETILVE